MGLWAFGQFQHVGALGWASRERLFCEDLRHFGREGEGGRRL